MAFIALADYLNANLWTGDKKLLKGLLAKNYSNLKTTEDMAKLLETHERQSR